MLLNLHVMEFTYLHVFLSVVGLGAGVFVVLGFFSSKRFSILTSTFIVSTFLTSLSGFLFPYHGVTPGIVIKVTSADCPLRGDLFAHMPGKWPSNGGKVYVDLSLRGALLQLLRPGGASLRQGPCLPLHRAVADIPGIRDRPASGLGAIHSDHRALGPEVSSRLDQLVPSGATGAFRTTDAPDPSGPSTTNKDPRRQACSRRGILPSEHHVLRIPPRL